MTHGTGRAEPHVRQDGAHGASSLDVAELADGQDTR
jgi:hypothetical protein